jgi:glyoxylase-like metal-dependent hydrolase (beta-lactamase superfamily II)
MLAASDLQPSRRQLLSGAAITGAALAIGLPARALAKAPMSNVQAPAFYRFKLGAFEATVVTDGPLPFGEPKDGIFKELSKADIEKVLADNYQPREVTFEQNVLVINTGERVVVFDTGLGTSKMFGPATGRLVPSLKAAGIDPKDVDAVVTTHAHADHCWGLMNDDGSRVFPNAQIYIAEADVAFWTDESKGTDDMMKSFIAGTRKQLLPNRDRMVFVKDGQEFLPGIHAIATPGHTVGHMSYMITSQGKSLCNTGDVAHHHLVATERPRAQFMFDTDGAQAVASRIRVFDMLAAQRIPLITYHFPWPGIGHVGKHGDAYRYFPSPMQMVL